MKKNKTLNDKIIQSVFTYETKKFTTETIIKMSILIISFCIILIFGGVIFDLIVESEIGELFKENSVLRFKEISSILFMEMPLWLIGAYMVGFVLGCIIIGIAIKNRKRIFHQIVSLFNYWTHT